MDIGADLLMVFDLAKEISQATASYNAGTAVTCSVYKSYGQNVRYETDEHGYRKFYNDLSVIMKASDLTGSIEPLKTAMYVDGTKYMVGALTTTYPTLLWISLRK